MTLEYQIFKPNPEKFSITPNAIVYGYWLLIIIILLLLIYFPIKPNSIIFVFVFTTAIALPIYFGISAYFNFEKLDGNFIDTLLINFNEITLGQIDYLIGDIVKIDFMFRDYYGKSDYYRGRGNYNPRISQGVSNFIEFTDKSNQKHIVYFKLNYKDDHERLFPFITEMIRLEKISLLRGIELLGINDYDKIQVFKKQLKMETKS